MRFIGASTKEYGKYWVRRYSKEEPAKLKTYIDGLRSMYSTATAEERADLAWVGNLAQAAHVKAFGERHP